MHQPSGWIISTCLSCLSGRVKKQAISRRAWGLDFFLPPTETVDITTNAKQTCSTTLRSFRAVDCE